MNEENLNKKFAFYAVALYRVGNYTDAALVGSIMFEKAVYLLLNEKNIRKQYVRDNKGRKGDLEFAIELMCRNYPQFSKNNLDDIRINIRNKITHEINIYEIQRDKIKPMILFILEVLDSTTYNLCKGNIDNIDFLRADYAIVGIREMFNENLQDTLAENYHFGGFKLEDFQELYKLRSKMISLGSKIKNEILKIKHKNELFIDIISKVDTTSAYVWMSMNLYNKDRVRINSASVSILGTPLDLRIYFDIGGGGYQVRQDYYKFLKSDCFKYFQENVDLSDMELFDNDWYCFIVDRTQLSEVSTEEMNNKIKKSEEKLAKYDENSILTWNKMLCGYILKRGEISFEDIESRLEKIIKLYYCFEYFRQHKLNYKEILFNYNIGNTCNKQIKRTPYSQNSLKIKVKK